MKLLNKETVYKANGKAMYDMVEQCGIKNDRKGWLWIYILVLIPWRTAFGNYEPTGYYAQGSRINYWKCKMYLARVNAAQ